jgi:hypothetical protein
MPSRPPAWLALAIVALVVGVTWWGIVQIRAPGSSWLADRAAPTGSPSPLVNQPLPSLAGASAWIGGRSMAPDSLAGSVVVVALLSLDFPSSVSAARALQSWHDAYARYGLRVIGVQVPEFAFAAEPRVMAATARRIGVDFPLGLDASLSVSRSFGAVSRHPRFVVAGPDRRVAIDREGLGVLGEVEDEIRALLQRTRPEVRFPRSSASRPNTAPGHAPVHLGRARVRSGPLSQVAPGRPVLFTAQLRYQVEGESYTPYPVGYWIPSADGATAARGGAEDFVALRYHAGALGAVLGPPKGAAGRLWILQDERWLEREEAGADVRFDGRGASYVEVKEPGLFALVRPSARTHVVKLSPESAGPTIYAFTFEPFER